MNTFYEIVLEERHDYVSFYSLLKEDEEDTITQQFFDEYAEQPEWIESVDILVQCMDEIGDRGAARRYFRFEDAAEAIPSRQLLNLVVRTSRYDLRLYCIRVSDEIVILLNGGVKTSQRVQDSPDLIGKFRFANRVSTEIIKKITDRDLIIRGNELEGDLTLYL